jgi:exosome complex component RRP42
LTTHLALLSTRIPALISEKDEDPLFNDDWEASTYLYPGSRHATNSKDGNAKDRQHKPPVTLLVMSVGENIIFDPSREELAVAEAVLAISITASVDGGNSLKVVALRTIDPPSRLTAAGTPIALTSVTGGTPQVSHTDAMALREKDQGQTIWRPPRGGMKRAIVSKMIKLAVEQGGVGQEVMDGLANVES